MKINDLIYDASLGMTGVIIGKINNIIDIPSWKVLYEDDSIDVASNDELEVISESR